MYDIIIFDLDGTLTDPAIGITNSVMYALKKFGIEVDDRSELYKFIGPPLKDGFMDYYGFSEQDALTAVEYYRENFRVKGIFENEVYAGIRECLAALQESGVKICLATSKPENMSVEILEHFGLAGFFTDICGATMDGSRSTKEDVIAYLLELCGSTDSMVMVGDTAFDVTGAAAHGIPAIGVTCTNPNVTAGNSYYFRICFLDNFQADVLANFAMDKFDAKVAYCLGESGNEYDQGLIAFFKQVFEAAGGTVITDSFPTGNSDFNSYLNKAKSEGADVIFTPVSIAYAVQIIKQAASLGIEAPFLGSDTLDDNMVLEAITGTDLELYVSTFYQEGGSAEFDAGIKEYINTNSEALAANGGNDTISAVTAMGYDAYFVALEAMKKADSGDKAALMQILPSVTSTGVSGAIAFDEIGDAVRDTAYIKTADTANGTWVLETVQTGSGN